MTQVLPRALSIAGSDPSGGAGLQADLKTFSALGVYGSTVVVAVVDENTQGVYDVHPVPCRFVAGQIRSVLGDVGADAVKIGMLHSAELIASVRDTLDQWPDMRDIVLDPVMVATSGDSLLRADAVDALRDLLIPRCRIITPNMPEASVLLGEAVDSPEQIGEAARELARSYNVSVLVKAGHYGGDVLSDVFYNVETGKMMRLESPRIETRNTHGTGCTLSSAITAWLARGADSDTAVLKGKEYLYGALRAGAGLRIGRGCGPVHHFYDLWR